MVMTHVGYFLRMPALVFSAACAVASTSKLSRMKNTAMNGEFLLMTSRSPLASGSAVMVGSGGIGVVSGTGVGGAGGGGAVVVSTTGGGGNGLATGGFFLPHAPAPTAIITIAIIASCLLIIRLSLII